MVNAYELGTTERIEGYIASWTVWNRLRDPASTKMQTANCATATAMHAVLIILVSQGQSQVILCQM